MKTIAILCLIGVVAGDQGYGAARAPTSEYGVPSTQYDAPRTEYGAPSGEYGAPIDNSRTDIPAPNLEYSAPLPLTRNPVPAYAAPPVVSVIRTPDLSYEAPAVAPVLKVDNVESTGYGAARIDNTAAFRTEEVRSSGQQVNLDVAWTAPAYQRLAFKKDEGYAASSGYSASSGYEAPKEGYGAPSTGYGAPATIEREVETVSAGGKAYIKLAQNIGESVGIRTYDSEGNVIDESYTDTDPSYRYAYGVEDQSTGDFKRVEEAREGGNAVGSYSFLQPDGCQRNVRYMTDEWGFKAIVEYRGPGCLERYEIQ